MLAVAGFFMMAVLRAIMGVIQKGVNEATGTGGGKQPTPKQGSPEVTVGGELKKCAACGVYNAASNSVTRVQSGATVYYCSTACRAKAAA